MDLISKATRNRFREALVGFVLREIEMFFEGAGLVCKEDHDPPVTGARRSLVERYYANIDFSSPTDIKKLLSAYGEIVLQVGRDDIDGTAKEDLLRLMTRDGYSFDGESFVRIPSKQQAPVEAIRAVAASLDLPGLQAELDRLSGAAEDDPSLVVGTAKEMVETICKTILEERGIPSGGQDLPQLVRAVAKELSILPDDIPERAKGAEVIRRILSNLNQISQGVAELRNLYGTGHGRGGRLTGVQPRHARLAVGAAATLGTFLMETHLERPFTDSGSQPAPRDLRS